MKYFIGIDPGLTGAIAKIGYDGEFIGLMDMPTIESPGSCGFVKRSVYSVDINLHLDIHFSHANAADTLICIEKVTARPNQGVSSVFSLGHSMGVIEGIARLYDAPIEYVTPQKWKKYYSLGKDKNDSLIVARKLFPDILDLLRRAKDHNRAEALLLANYAKHVFGG